MLSWRTRALKRAYVFGTVWVQNKKVKKILNMVYVCLWVRRIKPNIRITIASTTNRKKAKEKNALNETKVLFVYFICLAPLSSRFNMVFLPLIGVAIKNEEWFLCGCGNKDWTEPTNKKKKILNIFHISTIKSTLTLVSSEV